MLGYLLLSLRPKLKHLTKIRVAAVDYLNTKPLLYGLKKKAGDLEIDLVETYPAQLAQRLLEGRADLALVPVAVIPELQESHVITRYCIGCDGAVASVCIFSPVPMEKIKRVYLDYQSRTSVLLARILLKEYWHSDAEIIVATGEAYLKEIKGTTAALVIGDRALAERAHAAFIYDLGEAWKTHTGLPFVFAAWVSNRVLSPDFVRRFEAANGIGLLELEQVIKDNPYQLFDLRDYYTQYISYTLDDAKRKGLALFLEKCVHLQVS